MNKPLRLYLIFPPPGSRAAKKMGSNDVWEEAIPSEIRTSYVAEASHIIVFGGDGSLLHAIHDYANLGLPFFGVNFGTAGFLLNKVQDGHQLLEILQHGVESVELSMMEATFTSVLPTGKRTKTTAHAFNDVYFNANPGTVCRGTIRGEQYPLHRFIGDGLIVATPQGSTAYNRNAGGAVLSLRSGQFAIATICPQTFRDGVDEQRLHIRITNSDPVTAHADWRRFDQVKEIVIIPNERKIVLTFIQGSDFKSRRYAQGGLR